MHGLLFDVCCLLVVNVCSLLVVFCLLPFGVAGNGCSFCVAGCVLLVAWMVVVCVSCLLCVVCYVLSFVQSFVCIGCCLVFAV